MAARRLIGVLGGMGPLATVDFMRKVIAATPAACDQDHVPLIVYSVPQIPDRVGAVARGTDEPFPAILAGVTFLERAGVDLIVMPCNTAHAWFDRLAASTGTDMLHIAEAVRQRAGENPETLALMATRGTVSAGIYQRQLASPRRQMMIPSPHVQGLIDSAIAAVKLDDLATAQRRFSEASAALIEAGADRLLLACTELPLAVQGSPYASRCLDATVCLAQATVAFSMAGKADASALTGLLRDQEAGVWTSDGSRIS